MEKSENTLYPEQYELYEGIQKPVTRRNFFRLVGGGVGVALTVSDVLASTLTADFERRENTRLDDNTIAAWIHINEAGRIVVYTGKVEVGQNIRTSLTQIVAEELRVSVKDIDMIMGDTSVVPYDHVNIFN